MKNKRKLKEREHMKNKRIEKVKRLLKTNLTNSSVQLAVRCSGLSKTEKQILIDAIRRIRSNRKKHGEKALKYEIIFETKKKSC